MSRSAFGVDHGYVEKAFKMPGFKMPKMPGSFAGGAAKAKTGAQAFAGAASKPAAAMGNKLNAHGMNTYLSGTMKQGKAAVTGGTSRMGAAQQRVGLGMGQVGGSMMKNPGAYTAGAGGMAAGGAGAGLMNRKKKPGQY